MAESKTKAKFGRKQVIANAKAEGIACGAWFYRCNGRRPIRSAKTYAAIIPGKMSYDELTIECNANEEYSRFLDDNDANEDESGEILSLYCETYIKAALAYLPSMAISQKEAARG